MSASTTALLVASISAVVSLATAVGLEWSRRRATRELETLKDDLAQRREAATEEARARALVAKYRDPLLRSAYDLQSKIYNVLEGGFVGRRHPEYFRLNTLFVFAEFFGWLEIIRREMQFLDLGAVAETRELGRLLGEVQGRMASTPARQDDDYYVYRGEQRAIGEVMLIKLDGAASGGPRHGCMGYASFVAKLDDPDFAMWFTRLGEAISRLPGKRPERLIAVQRALIDLIDFLDPDKVRFPASRSRIEHR